MLAVFIALQARTAMPLLPLRVLTERNRAGSYLSLGLSVISMFGMFLLLSYYFQLVRGYSPVDAGLAFLPMAIAQATGATQIGARLTPHLQPRIIMSGGYLVTAVGVMMLALLEPDSSLLFVFAAEIVVGLGIGAAFMPATSIGTHGVEPRDMGVASAMIGTSQQIGGSIGTALLNTIAASSAAAYLGTHISAGKAQALVHGYSIAYWWGVGFLIVAAAISAFAVNARRPSMTAAEPTDDAETPRTEDSAVPVSHSAQA